MGIQPVMPTRRCGGFADEGGVEAAAAAEVGADPEWGAGVAGAEGVDQGADGAVGVGLVPVAAVVGLAVGDGEGCAGIDGVGEHVGFAGGLGGVGEALDAPRDGGGGDGALEGGVAVLDDEAVEAGEASAADDVGGRGGCGSRCGTSRR